MPFHEKHKGQFFCDRSAEDVINVLLAEGTLGGVMHWQPCSIKNITNNASNPNNPDAFSYQINIDRGVIETPQIVVATGGLSISKIGATDFGYSMAQQFGLRIVDTQIDCQ